MLDKMKAATNPAAVLTEELIGKVLSADVANVLKKVKSGKPLTSQERALIEAQSPAAREKVKTKAELARKIGVSKMLVQYHTKNPESPKRGEDGWDVGAWKEFLDRVGYATTSRAGDGKVGGIDYRVERALRERAERISAEVEAENAQRKSLPIEAAQEYINRRLAMVRQQFLAFTGLAPQVNPSDPPHAKAILDAAVDAALRACRDIDLKAVDGK